MNVLSHSHLFVCVKGGVRVGGCPVAVRSSAEEKPAAQFFRRKFLGKCSEPCGGAAQSKACHTAIMYELLPAARHSQPYGGVV